MMPCGCEAVALRPPVEDVALDYGLQAGVAVRGVTA
jgi:hypothetical protein